MPLPQTLEGRRSLYGDDCMTSLGLDLFEAEQDQAAAPETIPIVPNKKHTRARDGREFTVEDPQALIDAVRAGGVDIVVGRDHDEVGGLFASAPAPAAGWISHRDGLMRDGKYGIKGKVQWTDIGRAGVEAKHFRYVSPVLQLHWESMERDEIPTVTGIIAASIVNIPALRMASLNSAKPAQRGKETTMDEETRKRLCAAFGLPLDAKDETIMLAAEARQPEPTVKPSAELSAASVLADTVAKLSAQVSMLQARQEVANFGALPKELRELAESGFRAGGEVAELTRQIIARAAPGFAALATQDKPGAVHTEPNGLDDDDLKFCRDSGVKPESFAAVKAARLKVVR